MGQCLCPRAVRVERGHAEYDLSGCPDDFPGDPTCSSTPVSIPVATLQTNAAGNGVAYHVFTPADADGLHGMTLGGIWIVSAGGSPDYQTGCETIVLD
jgi:hypothetical protein